MSLAPEEEFVLRRLLAMRFSGASLYVDDGRGGSEVRTEDEILALAAADGG